MTSLTYTIEGTAIVYLTNSETSRDVGGGWRLSIRITDNGQMISIGRGGINSGTLHNRLKLGPRLPRRTVRKCLDIACAVVALDALDHDVKKFPPQELDL